MTTTWRNALICTLLAVGGSAVLGGCNNDVPTPPWYPHYVDSGYGGNGAAYGGQAPAAAGKGGEAGKGGDTGVAGTAGEPSEAAAGSTPSGGGEGGDGA